MPTIITAFNIILELSSQSCYLRKRNQRDTKWKRGSQATFEDDTILHRGTKTLCKNSIGTVESLEKLYGMKSTYKNW